MIHAFADGATTLSETLDMGYVVGGRVTGEGGGRVPSNPVYLSDAQSRVTVEADPGIEIQGNSQHVRDISFVGPGKYDASGMRAIYMSHPTGTSGLSQGRCMLSNLNFADFPTAIQLGRDNTSSWADTSEFRMLAAQDCERMFHVLNNQAMSHTFSGIFAEGVDYVFDVEGGGVFDIRNVAITQVDEGDNCTLLRTGNSSYVGHHNGTFNISLIKIDNQVSNRVTLVEMTDNASCDFNIFGGLNAAAGHVADYTNPLFVMHPRGVLNIYGLRGMYPNCIRLDGASDADPIIVNVLGGAVGNDSGDLGDSNDPGWDVRDLIDPASDAKGILTSFCCYQHISGRQVFRGRYQSRVGAW